MEPQLRSWTCSICALDWLLRATGLDPWSTREKVAAQVGYPECIDEWSGLKATACLQRVIQGYGVEARQEWVGFGRAYQLASETAYILNSTSWYHFVGGRGVAGDSLWIANSSKGYRGVFETINASQWKSLPGWQLVWLVR